jgi:NAD(P) transhydrogenase
VPVQRAVDSINDDFIGQAVMASGMPIDYFVGSVFNYPTLAECYKVAALDGMNRVRITTQQPAAGLERAA